MKEALQSTLILILWVAFWLAGTIGGAVLEARLIDIGVVSDIDPPWIITIGSSFIGFFAGAPPLTGSVPPANDRTSRLYVFSSGQRGAFSAMC